jgi:hypothetical protein
VHCTIWLVGALSILSLKPVLPLDYITVSAGVLTFSHVLFIFIGHTLTAYRMRLQALVGSSVSTLARSKPFADGCFLVSIFICNVGMTTWIIVLRYTTIKN